jgi:hypothetical protein
MPSNTLFKPLSNAEFTADKLNFHGQGAIGVCDVHEVSAATDQNPAVFSNQELHIDLEVLEDTLLSGGILMVKGGKMADKISMQVCHPTAGILNEYVSNYRVCEDSQKQFELENAYPAKLMTGLILRVKYEACEEPGVRTIAVNYKLHKVLV